MSATHHDYTQHGYPCCHLVSADPPPLISMCGGPGYRCKQCDHHVKMIHALRPSKAPDDTRAADYLAGQKQERASIVERLRGLGPGRSTWSLGEIADFLETFPFHLRPEAGS